MIELSQQLCEELDLTYWQLNNASNKEKKYYISREEKELLRKILLAKGISLTNISLKITDQAIVIVTVNKHQLIFEDVTKKDVSGITYLAKISEMLNSQEQKKLTWYKLKNLELL
ncbi:MAG: hypothetical protein AB8B80_01590 [Marinicellaceae bacterium]